MTAVIMMLVTTCRGLGAFTTGNDLYGMCTSSGEPFMDCIGYVRGVLDAGDYEGDAQGLIKELQQGIYSPGSTISSPKLDHLLPSEEFSGEHFDRKLRR